MSIVSNHNHPSKGGLHKGYKPKGYWPTSQCTGFNSVQARPLTRRHPLKDICTICHL